MHNNYFDAYLDGMFAGYPDTSDTRAARRDLRAMMDDKYEDLTASGMTTNTAIGSVIAEFGDLDEVAPLLGLTTTDLDDSTIITPENARSYLTASYQQRLRRSIGIGLLISSPAPLLLFLAIRLFTGPGSSAASALFAVGVFLSLVFVGAGIALLMRVKNALDPFQPISQSRLLTTSSARETVREWRDGHQLRQGLITALGRATLIVSPLPLIVAITIAYYHNSSIGIGLAAMVFLLGCGCAAYAYDNATRTAEREILQEGIYSPARRTQRKWRSPLAICYWVVVIAILMVMVSTMSSLHVALIFTYFIVALAVYSLGRDHFAFHDKKAAAATQAAQDAQEVPHAQNAA